MLDKFSKCEHSHCPSEQRQLPCVPCHSWSVDGYILQQISYIWKAFIASIVDRRNYFWPVIKEFGREDALAPDGSHAIQSALLRLKEPGMKTYLIYFFFLLLCESLPSVESL